jgi:catechol 2,3-dioxygenase-like lactoylglutathione lyase family enzyme
MKRFLPVVAATIVCLPLAAQDKSPRPRITGIHHVRFYVSNIEKSREFYGSILGFHSSDYRCSGLSHSCFGVRWGRKQHIELQQATAAAHKNWLAEVAFETDNITQMRRYLVAHGAKVGAISRGGDDTQHFELNDPEGNLIAFVGYPKPSIDDPPFSNSPSEDIIHAGFVVHDRAAEDLFYKDILGFHVYWHGGMKDDETNWVDMQVPDGTDWIEYMLNVSPNADHHTLGVMNHIALGVPDIKAAREQLTKNGWSGDETPKIGRDGKWQLNLYDPDDTRVELMEFTPTQKPCCSEYTGPHPGPKQ